MFKILLASNYHILTLVWVYHMEQWDIKEGEFTGKGSSERHMVIQRIHMNIDHLVKDESL